MTNNKFKEKKNIEVQTPSLYELNKQLIEKQNEPLLDDKVYDALDYVVQPFFEKNYKKTVKQDNADSCYFMLLCREDNNYTVFNMRNYLDIKVPLKIACDELLVCLNNRGTIYSIEKTEDEYAIEIWVKDKNKGMLCYYLFPYNEGVIEI